jgi:pimeloyl-ACP methyl ester carboxylesterase
VAAELGRVRAFFDALSADPTRIPRHARDAYVAAYARPDALRTGFEWYRAFAQDAKDNIESKETAVPIPTLCIRGSREPGRLEDYVRGLRDAGFARARGERIDDCGHFSPDEQPAALAAALRRFLSAKPPRHSQSASLTCARCPPREALRDEACGSRHAPIRKSLRARRPRNERS